jgi:FkbM family methyltransferase
MTETYKFIPKTILTQEKEAPLRSVARRVLPRPVKSFIKTVLYEYKKPHVGPYHEVEIGGTRVSFVMDNPQDVRRLHSGFEKNFSRAIMKRVHEYPKGTVIYNIGAAQGFYACLTAAAGARVFAFEPDPENCQALRRNLTHNNLFDRVSTYAVALGHTAGEVTLYTEGVRGAAPSLADNSGQRKSIVVPILRLDDVVAVNRTPPDVIIMDVEGAEGLVLAGAHDLLSSGKRPKDIFIELHPRYLPSFGAIAEEVWKSIMNYGYTPQMASIRSGEIHAHFQAE